MTGLENVTTSEALSTATLKKDGFPLNHSCIYELQRKDETHTHTHQLAPTKWLYLKENQASANAGSHLICIWIFNGK